jgi:thiol:disulfide interchange protein
VTANNAQDKALLKHLNVLGCQPFCSSMNKGRAAEQRVTGFMDAAAFSAFAQSPTVNNTLNGTTVGNNGGDNRAT